MLAQSSASVPKAQVVNSAQARGAQASATAREVENRAGRRAERDEAWRQRAVDKASRLWRRAKNWALRPTTLPMFRSPHRGAGGFEGQGRRQLCRRHLRRRWLQPGLAFLGKATRVLALDRDPEAVLEGQALVERAADASPSSKRASRRSHAWLTISASTASMAWCSTSASPRCRSTTERGFSFRHDGPLDMRMSREGLSAADLVAASSAQSLADMLRFFGEGKICRTGCPCDRRREGGGADPHDAGAPAASLPRPCRPGTRRYRSGDPHLPGAAHRRQRGARRARARAYRSGLPARLRRPARRRRLSFARGSHRQAFPSGQDGA